MKTIIILITLLLTFNVNASEKYSSKKLEHCETVAEISKNVMDFRQSGIEMSKILKAKGFAGSDTLKRVVIMAYEEPRLESLKEKMTIDFKNKIHVLCLKEFSFQ